mmetsp:Transcript_19112/g.53224  ORF Transcript_19112/g.53224 Transcript_19112/m.53224 type:complete len:211 (+) Transcript_19112:619-1251(+)
MEYSTSKMENKDDDTDANADQTEDESDDDEVENDLEDAAAIEDEALPKDLNCTNNAESHHDILESTDQNLNSEFRKILNHHWKDGILIFKAQFVTDVGNVVLDIPLRILQKDQPVQCAKYIKMYIVENSSRRSSGPLGTWADSVLKENSNIIRRLRRVKPAIQSEYSVNDIRFPRKIRRSLKNPSQKKKRLLSRNQRLANNMMKRKCLSS